MGLKVRVLASSPSREEAGAPATHYRAEAYDEADPFRERRWACEHEHDSVEAALECGTDWLAAHGKEAASA